MKDYSNHFRELVKRQLGNDPRILVPRGAQDMMILATWRLAGDGFRPGNRSRMIRIAISQDPLGKYAGGRDSLGAANDGGFVAWVRPQCGGLNPNRGAPVGGGPSA